MPDTFLVAPRKPPARNNKDCLVCRLPGASLQFINAAIWDGTRDRVKAYRDRGVEAYLLSTGNDLDPKTITRHAEHVEKSWREVTPEQPARSNELPVFPGDYESLVETAAELSVKAMRSLTQKIDAGELGDRELLGAAKMGVVARGHQEQLRTASKKPALTLTAIFGLASGHLAVLPEAEAIEVYDEVELADEVRAEKARLVSAARGE